MPGPPRDNGPRVSYHVTGRETPLVQLAWAGPDPQVAGLPGLSAAVSIFSARGPSLPMAGALDDACNGAITSYEANITEFPGFLAADRSHRAGRAGPGRRASPNGR